MTENEFILMLRSELQPIKDEIRTVQEDLHDFKLYVENAIEPKINILAENYVPAAKRYERTTPEINDIKRDIEVMKKIRTGHSEKLQKIS